MKKFKDVLAALKEVLSVFLQQEDDEWTNWNIRLLRAKLQQLLVMVERALK